MQVTIAARFHHLAWNIVSQQCRKTFREGKQRCQVNARRHAHLIEHMHDVFRADVGRRAGSERTTAETTKRSVEANRSAVERGTDICEH